MLVTLWGEEAKDFNFEQFRALLLSNAIVHFV